MEQSNSTLTTSTEELLRQITEEFNQRMAPRMFDSSNPACERLVLMAIDGEYEEIREVFKESISEQVENKWENLGSIKEKITSTFLDLIEARLKELATLKLRTYICDALLGDIRLMASLVGPSCQEKIADFDTKLELFAPISREDVKQFEQDMYQLLSELESMVYQPTYTFSVAGTDQTFTFDHNQSATVLNTIGDTDTMMLDRGESFRRPSEISVMMGTPKTPYLKVTKDKLADLSVGQVVSKIPWRWHTSTANKYFAVKYEPHIRVTFA